MKLKKCKCGNMDWVQEEFENSEYKLICYECGEPYPDLHKENEELEREIDIISDRLRLTERSYGEGLGNLQKQNSDLEKKIDEAVDYIAKNSYTNMGNEYEIHNSDKLKKILGR